MKRIVTAALAAGILVAGVFVATVVSGDAATAQEAEPQITETRPSRGEVLDEVLGGLVDDGVIDDSQAEAVKAALLERADEVREQQGDRLERRHRRLHIRDLLDDGVIDAEELASLPDGHPLRNPDGPAGPYLDDGQLTLDELQQIREQHRAERQAAVEDANV